MVSLRRVVLLTTVALAALAASSVASAVSGGAPAWTSTCGAATQFSSLDQLAVSSTARGDEAREPSFNQTIDSPGAQRGRGRGFRATVPTYVHVVSLPDGTGNVSDRAIRDQIRVLNSTYAGFEGGYATGFSFELAGVTRTVNADWYYASFGSDERDMKRALRQGGDNGSTCT